MYITLKINYKPTSLSIIFVSALKRHYNDVKSTIKRFFIQLFIDKRCKCFICPDKISR